MKTIQLGREGGCAERGGLGKETFFLMCRWGFESDCRGKKREKSTQIAGKEYCSFIHRKKKKLDSIKRAGGRGGSGVALPRKKNNI